MNFTLQDILGATLAFCLFPLVIVFPGYVVGWALDLFDFRRRQPIVRLGIGIALSFAVSPIVLHLTSSLLSFNVALLTLTGFAAAFVIIILKEKFVAALEDDSGRAAILKDRSMKKDAPAEATSDGGMKKPKMLAGLIFAIISGVLCACYGVAASYTGPLAKIAEERFHNEPWRVSCATTAVILWGGAISSCLYCAFKLTRNGTWKLFATPGTGRTLGLALAMAFLHNGAIYLFNLGFPKLGDLGVSVGYAAFMSFAIIVGNLHGFRTGEWKGASRQGVAWIVTGIVILVIGVCILGKGNAMS